MKYFQAIFIMLFLTLISCKKETIDATNTKTMQASINDMTSDLPTLKQEKFNEALYILKTFRAEGGNDFEKLKSLGKIINGKKVPEILQMADETAAKNGIAWTSNGPPSLGEMNIFGNENAKEFDPNDVGAAGLDIRTVEISKDSVLGAKALQIIPRLVDGRKNPVTFSGAALATTMEISNTAGTKLLTAKNLMTDNNFKGFSIRFAQLPKDKIIDNQIDAKITVKTAKKTYTFTKTGIPVNGKALFVPVKTTVEDEGTAAADTENTAENTDTPNFNEDRDRQENPAAPTGDPKKTVSKFLNNLGAQNLRAAYDASENPAWGSFDSFSNPNSGFGGAKNLKIKNISNASTTGNAASVSASYDVTDENGKTTPLKVTFGLKNVNGTWKITSYRIN